MRVNLLFADEIYYMLTTDDTGRMICAGGHEIAVARFERDGSKSFNRHFERT